MPFMHSEIGWHHEGCGAAVCRSGAGRQLEVRAQARGDHRTLWGPLSAPQRRTRQAFESAELDFSQGRRAQSFDDAEISPAGPPGSPVPRPQATLCRPPPQTRIRRHRPARCRQRGKGRGIEAFAALELSTLDADSVRTCAFRCRVEYGQSSRSKPRIVCRGRAVLRGMASIARREPLAGRRAGLRADQEGAPHPRLLRRVRE